MSLNYKRVGEGQPLLLMHGLFGSLDNLGMISRAMRNDFDVISVDLPDHGMSPHTQGFKYDAYAEHVLRLMDSLSIESFYALGHSMGGKVAMHLALHHPHRVKKLVVADIAPVKYTPRHNAVFNALTSVDLNSISSRKDAEDIMMQHLEEPGVAQFLLRSLGKDDNGKFVWRFNLELLMRDYEHLSQEIAHPHPFTKPTLFVKGGNSNYISAEHRPIINALFPNAEAKIIQGTGHWLHAEKPNVFAKIVTDFLTRN